MKVASFDIGKRNFSFYVEEFDEKEFVNLKVDRLKKNRYFVNGRARPLTKKALECICKNGKCIEHINTDLAEKTGVKLDEIFHRMYEFLRQYDYLWNECDYILIEKQMQFGLKTNVMASKLGQHCYSYFVFRYGRTKKIIEFPAYHKTQVLGAPKILKGQKWIAMTKPQRKNWTVREAIRILKLRGDSSVLTKMTEAAKKDDLADTLTQLQSFKFLRFVTKNDF